MSGDTTVLRVVLRPRGPMSRVPGSDTLFGAICWAYRSLFGSGALEELLDSFGQHQDRFRVSSAFPFVTGAAGRTWLLPMPLTLGLPGSARTDMDGDRVAAAHRLRLARQVEKTSMVSEAIFRECLNPGASLCLADRLAAGELRSVGSWLASTEELEGLDDRAPGVSRLDLHNVIDRLLGTTGGGGGLFSTEMHYLPRGTTGLYFWLVTQSPGRVVPAIRLMAESGLGGDRSSGSGVFDLEVRDESPPFELRGPSSHFVCLSRYLPLQDEVDWAAPLLAYRLIPVRSIVEGRDEFRGGNLWKNMVRYVAEGSVLACGAQEPEGCLPVVAQPAGKRVRQNGTLLGAFFDEVSGDAA